MIMFQIISHSAKTDISSPPNTLRGIEECVEKEIYFIEFDLSPLSSGDFLLFHNECLDPITNRKGLVFLLNASEKQDIWYLNERGEKDRRVAYLSELIPLINEYSTIREFQLDLKNHISAPLTEKIIHNLLCLITPVKHKIRITSRADWALRILHHFDPEVKLGFDPHFYLDWGRKEASPFPPYNKARFSYQDDHPLATCNWTNIRDYLSMRAECLWYLEPDVEFWYFRYAFLKKSIEDGFNWSDFLHRRGAKVCAWTLNISEENKSELLDHILEMELDLISTETLCRWNRLLGRN